MGFHLNKILQCKSELRGYLPVEVYLLSFLLFWILMSDGRALCNLVTVKYTTCLVTSEVCGWQLEAMFMSFIYIVCL